MDIRLFDLDKDFAIIKNWITDERTNMLWCANRIQYPMSKTIFKDFLKEISDKYGDIPYVAVDDADKPAGFYAYSVNEATKEGMLKFVVVDPDKRGKGIAREMLGRVVATALADENVQAVQLNVFSVNEPARKCYQNIGFVERNVTKEAVNFGDETWDRINMLIKC